jgi:hypothetical protein
MARALPRAACQGAVPASSCVGPRRLGNFQFFRGFAMGSAVRGEGNSCWHWSVFGASCCLDSAPTRRNPFGSSLLASSGRRGFWRDPDHAIQLSCFSGEVFVVSSAARGGVAMDACVSSGVLRPALLGSLSSARPPGNLPICVWRCDWHPASPRQAPLSSPGA